MADYKSSSPLVTFIVPSVGRPTLERALKSLANQTDMGFTATLVMDGCPPPSYASNFRWLRVIVNQKRVGVMNYAGAVRNRAIQEASTEWIAFLDDDDTLSPSYVEHLRNEINMAPSADAVIFRMRTNKAGRGLRVLPPQGASDFTVGRVGISFAVKRLPACLGGNSIFCFEPGSTEDFVALDFLRRSKALIILSPRVAYFVEMEPVESSSYEKGESAKIKM